MLSHISFTRPSRFDIIWKTSSNTILMVDAVGQNRKNRRLKGLTNTRRIYEKREKCLCVFYIMHRITNDIKRISLEKNIFKKDMMSIPCLEDRRLNKQPHLSRYAMLCNHGYTMYKIDLDYIQSNKQQVNKSYNILNHLHITKGISNFLGMLTFKFLVSTCTTFKNIQYRLHVLILDIHTLGDILPRTCLLVTSGDWHDLNVLALVAYRLGLTININIRTKMTLFWTTQHCGIRHMLRMAAELGLIRRNIRILHCHSKIG
ncbi:hypothetical protein ACJX0J_021550 [Zea mays]